MSDNELLLKVTVQGADEAAAQLKTAGAATDEFAKKTSDIGGDLDKLYSAFSQGAINSEQLRKGVDDVGDAAHKAGDDFKFAGELVKAFSKANFNDLKTSMSDAIEAAGGFKGVMADLGKEIRALGHIADIPGLSHIAGVLRGIAHIGAPAAFAAIGVALGGMSVKAAEAYEKTKQLAFQVNMEPQEYEKATHAFDAAGASSEAMGKALGKLPEIMSKASQAEDKLSQEQNNYSKAVEQANNHSNQLAGASQALGQKQNQLLQAVAHGKMTWGQYAQAMQQVGQENSRMADAMAEQTQQDIDREKQHEKNIEALNKQTKAVREFAAEMKQLQAAGKNTEKTSMDMVKAFGQLADSTDKSKLALELWGKDAEHFVELSKKTAEELDAIAKESERLNPATTKEQAKAFEELAVASKQVSSAWEGFSKQLATLMTPTVTQFFTWLKDKLVEWREALKDATPGIQKFIEAIVSGAKMVLVPLGLIKDAFVWLVGEINQFTEVLKGIGIYIQPWQLWLGIVVALAVAFGGWLVVLTAVLAVIGYIVTKWPEIKKGAVDTVDAIKQKWEAFKQFWVDLWNGIKKAWDDMWKYLQQTWDAFVKWFNDKTKGMLTTLNNIVSAAKEAYKWIKAALGGGDTGGAETAPQGAARGGRIFGPGSATSDSVLARLSAGEWVINAGAVAHYGDRMMAAINSMRYPRGFAAGGLVGYAAGGSAPRQIFNLTIGNETFSGMTAPAATANRLVQYAVSQQIKSAGRKPTWYGS